MYIYIFIYFFFFYFAEGICHQPDLLLGIRQQHKISDFTCLHTKPKMTESHSIFPTSCRQDVHIKDSLAG